MAEKNDMFEEIEAGNFDVFGPDMDAPADLFNDPAPEVNPQEITAEPQPEPPAPVVASGYTGLVQGEAKQPIKVNIAHSREVADYLKLHENPAVKAQWEEYSDKVYEAVKPLKAALQKTDLEELKITVEVPFKREPVLMYDQNGPMKDKNGNPAYLTKRVGNKDYTVQQPSIGEDGKLQVSTYVSKQSGEEKQNPLNARIQLGNYNVNVRLGADKEDPMKANGKVYGVSVTKSSKNFSKIEVLKADQLKDLPENVKAVMEAAKSCIAPTYTKVEKAIVNGAKAVTGTKTAVGTLQAPKVEVPSSKGGMVAVDNVYTGTYNDKNGNVHLYIKSHDNKDAAIDISQNKYGELKATYTLGDKKPSQDGTKEFKVYEKLDLGNVSQVTSVVPALSSNPVVQQDIYNVMNSINAEFANAFQTKSVVAEAIKAIDNKKYANPEHSIPEVSTMYDVNYDRGTVLFKEDKTKTALNITTSKDGSILMYYKDEAVSNREDGKVFIGKNHPLSEFFEHAGASNEAKAIVVESLKETKIFKEKSTHEQPEL